MQIGDFLSLVENIFALREKWNFYWEVSFYDSLFKQQRSSTLYFIVRCTESQILYEHRQPAQSVCVTVCNFIINVLDSTFASSVAIYR